MKKCLILLLSGLLHAGLYAQQDPFIGSFTNAATSISLKIKSVDDEYHGLIQTYGSSFAFRAYLQDGIMNGTIYRPDDKVRFTAVQIQGGLQMNSEGYRETFYMLSYDHQLANVDLNLYLPEGQEQDEAEAWLPGEQTTAPNPVEETSNAPESEMNPEVSAELHRLISGGQLVFYRRTSYVSSSTASSMTYVNFCPDGSFNTSTDGSYSVEGDYGGNVHGASRAADYGRWEVLTHNGSPAIKLTYADGNTSINLFSRERLRKGRWRIGNTQYAFQRGKAVCR
jgi:hypothetical protein